MNNLKKYNLYSIRKAYQCDNCGKQSHFVKRYTATINSGYDWEDTVDEQECLHCLISVKIKSICYRIRSIKIKRTKKMLIINTASGLRFIGWNTENKPTNIKIKR